MKSIKTIAAVVAVLAMGSLAQAGMRRSSDCGASKCCDCAPTFQPTCCKPKIVRPCHRNVYNYQRTCAKACCDNGCGPSTSCCPTGAGNGCVNGAGNCAAPCANGAGCDNGAANNCTGNACAGANNCAAPCGTGAGNNCCTGNACAGANNCAAPCGTGAGCDNGAGNTCCNGNACAGANNCAGTGCAGDSCCATTCQDACQIAQLIYESQTACYARQRRAAIAKLGNKYDCVCNPEIMSAFIYALNDADERVRTKAADEIGDQLRKNKCCCSQCVVEALTVSLADCDRGVRRQAEQALRQCGYDIVDPCCEVACDTGCAGDACCNNGAGCVGNGCAPAPASAEPAPAAPAPPAEPKAYFPKRINDENARPVSAKKKSLSNLFGLVR